MSVKIFDLLHTILKPSLKCISLKDNINILIHIAEKNNCFKFGIKCHNLVEIFQQRPYPRVLSKSVTYELSVVLSALSYPT